MAGNSVRRVPSVRLFRELVLRYRSCKLLLLISLHILTQSNSFIDILKGDDEYLFVLDMIEGCLVDADVKKSRLRRLYDL